jgi:AraC-like DNA-binding protein
MFSIAFYDVIRCGFTLNQFPFMPRIIRQALYQKLRELPELQEFQRDFELLSGLSLGLVNELGVGDCGRGGSRLCEVLAQSESGRAMCARLRHGLLADASEHPVCGQCDAGLAEVVVPLRVGGIHAGYFVFGGVAKKLPDLPDRQRVRHLMRKACVEIDDEKLDQLLGDVRVVSEDVLGAYQRMVHLAAKHIVLRVTDQLVESEDRMPPAVMKACGFIRARALVEDLDLSLVARHCGVSEGHLSRLFHHATGLTFREYVAQVRLEHAKSLLLRTGKGVTEIAFECGFQSVSQFHRVFRKAHGKAPGQMRSEQRLQAES